MQDKQDKRSEVRLLCADMLDVSWTTMAGHARHATALLEDISHSGACLQLEAPVPLGTEMKLRCRKQSFSGTVRYCVYREIGYFVGVEFGEESRWKPSMFKPQHLLDLQQLAANARKPEAD
jgi:hypothetical protein